MNHLPEKCCETLLFLADAAVVDLASVACRLVQLLIGAAVDLALAEAGDAIY
jgi:hypothetical protein